MVAEENSTSSITNARMVAYAFSKIADFKQICSRETTRSALAILRLFHAKMVAVVETQQVVSPMLEWLHMHSQKLQISKICSTEIIGSALAIIRLIHAKMVVEGNSTEAQKLL
jgi:hypothetical protein